MPTVKVIITSLPEKLPEEVRNLINEDRALPAGTTFFEERLTLQSAVQMIAIGIVLVVIGILIGAVGILELVSLVPMAVPDYVPLIAGLVCIFGGYLLISSMRGRMRLRRAQQNGVATRYGIFLWNDILVSRSFFDVTVIPRSFFKGIESHAVKYELDGNAKSFKLPAEVVGKEARDMQAAIKAWGRAG